MVTRKELKNNRGISRRNASKEKERFSRLCILQGGGVMTKSNEKSSSYRA